jgi:hypothetical protein
VVLIDRIGVSIANNAFGKQWLYFIDRSTVAKVYGNTSTLSSNQPVSKKFVKYIREARQLAIDARDTFDSCSPSFPKEHWNWREVDTDKLTEKVEHGGKLKLTKQEMKTLSERMEWEKSRSEKISFNKFCLFIGEALRDRFDHEDDEELNSCSVSKSFSAAVDCYTK